MRNSGFFLMIFVILAIFLSSIASVAAQEIDVDSMDNAQLTDLLLQILNKLQQEGDPEVEADPIAVTPEIPASATAVPAADPEAIEEIIQITIYENKKLIIEALPSYMFIQPTKPVKPEPPETPGKTNNNDNNNNNDDHETDDSHGFVWDDDEEFCPPPYHWECYPDRCVCASPNG